MKRILALVQLTAVLPFTLAQGTDGCATLDRLVRETYNFKPSQLSASQRISKGAAMDRFWDTVMADPKLLLPCLRAMLQDQSADKWFRFDASNLLVGLDPSPASKALQVRGYTDVDLDDVDLRTWVSLLALRGFEGFDVSEAGSRWLAYPGARYFLPEHGAYEVGAFQGALFMFGSMDESQATPALVKIVSQANHPGREHALLILMDQATPEALRALKHVDPSPFSGRTRSRLNELLTRPDLLKPRARPKTSRGEFMRVFQSLLQGDWSRFSDLVRRVPDGEKDVVAVLKPEDFTVVRKVRRMMIARGNQHAIDDYRDFTAVLMGFVWKPDFVK